MRRDGRSEMFEMVLGDLQKKGKQMRYLYEILTWVYAGMSQKCVRYKTLLRFGLFVGIGNQWNL